MVGVPNSNAKLKARLKKEEDKFKKQIGQRLHEARIARGLSMGQLSEASGVNRGNIGKIEAGKNSPAYITMYRLAVALDVFPDYFLF